MAMSENEFKLQQLTDCVKRLMCFKSRWKQNIDDLLTTAVMYGWCMRIVGDIEKDAEPIAFGKEMARQGAVMEWQ